MDKVVKAIESSLELSKMEITDNLVYQIKCEDPILKEELKRLLVQGNSSISHTTVEIDFTNPPEPKKKKWEITGIETFKYPVENVIIKLCNSPIYIYGEYIKLSREMTQTPLRIKGKYKSEHSVSDFGKDFNNFFGGNDFKFMGCGREDIDVRCLEGRPFILEISNPTINLNANFMSINFLEGIDIKNCHIATKECKDYVNREDPSKLYNLLIFSEERINFEKKYELDQKTPLRVLHRRANMIREKTIEILRTEGVESDGFYYDVDIKASSGAYIKEWVNGDFNRTIPNLNSDILELDVITVALNVEKSLFIRSFELIRN